MALMHKPVVQVEEADLRQLIDAKVSEARDIDYKRQTYGDADADRAEWLADVSSFANTVGGDLVIGMDAEAGIPIHLCPVALDLDKEILRLEQIARSSLEPRLTNLDFKRIQISNGGEVLLARVHRSFNPPHRIVKSGKGQGRFWARSAAGKYEPNVDELRTLFTLAPQLGAQAQAFRYERLAKITAQMTPVNLMTSDCLAVHVISLSSFQPTSLLSLSEVANSLNSFAPMGSSFSPNLSVNMDGILIGSNTDELAAIQRAYVQIYRSGRIESVASSMVRRSNSTGVPPRLTSSEIESKLVPALLRYSRGLHNVGVEPPYLVLVSLIGIMGVNINAGPGFSFVGENLSTQRSEQLNFVDVLMDVIPNSVEECGRMLRPMLEQLANAAGELKSSSFDDTGRYLPTFSQLA